MYSTRHEPVYHAAQSCQGKRSGLTALSLRGLFWICQVESQKNAGFLARVESGQQAQRLLSSSVGMVQLRLWKGRRLITLSMGPHRKDDPDPHISKCPDGNRVAFPLRSFALIVVLCPCFTLGALPRKLMQGVAQRFDAPQPAMSFGIHATLIEDRRGSSQCLQAGCILVTLSIIPNLRKPPGSQVLPRTRQTFKDGVILMGQKKGADRFVIVGNLFNEWQQLANLGQQQARCGACEYHIALAAEGGAAV